MENRRFIALGDLIADCYYNGTKLLGIDGGSSRFNVIANLAHMNCKTAVVGGCGNDKIGANIIKRLAKMGTDTSKIFGRDRATRAYHLIIDQATLPKITYQCSKQSPKDGKSTWYEDNVEDIQFCYSEIRENDVIVLDTADQFSLAVIEKLECEKILDIGNAKQLAGLDDDQISLLRNQIEILQLNKRVVPYLMQRLECTNILGIYKFFYPKLMIVTCEKDGAVFAFEDTVYRKKLLNSAKEIDPTGAGDAFLSVFIKKYYENSKKVDYEFIDTAFNEAIALTSKVVQNVGARGHLYEKTLDTMVEKNKRKKINDLEYEL